MASSKKNKKSQIKLDPKLLQQFFRDELNSLASSDLDDKQMLNHINNEYKSIVDQQTKDIEEKNEDLPLLPDGYIERKMINGCGPYYYLRTWNGKTHSSIYLGKLN